jgi:hypothetical protein
MTQGDRDRLVVLRNLKARRIRQTEAAEQLEIATRQVRRLLLRYKEGSDRAMVHGLRGLKVSDDLMRIFGIHAPVSAVLVGMNRSALLYIAADKRLVDFNFASKSRATW